MKRKEENNFLKKELQVKDMLIRTLIHFIAKNKIELPLNVIDAVEKLYPKVKENGSEREIAIKN